MTARQGPVRRMPQLGVRARWRAAAPSPGTTPPAALPAKLRPPQVRVHLVERRALIGALDEASAPLVVLCAPAGAGKTTLLRQWSEADARPFAWVQLDEADSDPVRAAHVPVAGAGVDHRGGPERQGVALAGGAARPGADPAARRRGPGGGARLRPRPRRRARAQGRQGVGGRRLRAAEPARGRAAGHRVAERSRRSRWRGCARPATSRSSGRRELSLRPERGRRAHAPARLRGGRGDGRRRPRRDRGLGHRPAAGVPGACRQAAGRVAAGDPRQPSRDRRVPDLGGAGRAAGRRPGVPAAHLGAAGAHAAAVRAGHRERRRWRPPRPRRPRGALRRAARGRRLPLPLPPPVRGDAAGRAGAASSRPCRTSCTARSRPGTRARTCRTRPSTTCSRQGSPPRPATWWPRRGPPCGAAARPRPCGAGSAPSPTARS